MDDNEILQNEDFIAFTIDGHREQLDLFEAHDQIVKIDLKHKDDPWKCFGCCSAFSRELADVSTECPLCGGGPIERDYGYLSDVAAWLVTKGFQQVSVRTAAKVYDAIVSTMDLIKKKEMQRLESLIGTASTPPTGPADANGSI